MYENTEKHLKFQVRRRASNESTEAAASGIASFLELDGNEETSQGWMLISTLNLLAAAGENLVEVPQHNYLQLYWNEVHTEFYSQIIVMIKNR